MRQSKQKRRKRLVDNPLAPRRYKKSTRQILFIAKDKPGAALKQNILIEQRVQMLAKFPELGTYDPKYDAFRLVIGIAYYRILGDCIEIFRFVHGKQKPS